MEGLDGPGLASLAGLTSRDIATAMGLRVEDQKLKQQAYRDFVNSLYMQSIMGKLGAETERLRPTIPYKVGGKTVMVSQPDYLKLKQLEISAMSAIEKEYGLYAAQEKAAGRTPMSLEEYKIQNNTWVQQYKFYSAQELKAGREPKDFSPWVKEQRRAGAPSIGYLEEKAGRVRGAVSGVDVLGEEGYSKARKQAAKELESDPDYFGISPEEGESTEDYIARRDATMKSMMDARTNEVYESMLKAQFGSENVSPLLNDPTKGNGWKVRKRDGSIIWRGVVK